MDAKFYSVHKKLEAEDAKLLVIAQALYTLLRERQSGQPIDSEEIDSLCYKLDEAFNFEL